MKRLYSLISLLAVASAVNLNAELNNLSQAEDKAGWKLLFDGKSMEHLRGYKKDKPGAAWKVEDGAIKLAGKGGGDLMTKEKYQFF